MEKKSELQDEYDKLKRDYDLLKSEYNKIRKYLLSTLYVLGILLISNRSTLRSSYSHFQFKKKKKKTKAQTV